MGDHVADPLPCAKFHQFHHDTIIPFNFLNMRKYASSDSASFLVLLSAYTDYDLFSGSRNKILYFDPIFSKKGNLGPIFDGN